MVFGELALQVGGEPDPSQRPSLREKGFRIKHCDGEEQSEAMLLTLRSTASCFGIVNNCALSNVARRVCYDLRGASDKL